MSNINNLRRTPREGLKCGQVICLHPTELRRGAGYVVWNCRCQCGVEVLVGSDVLARQKFISCGCEVIERARRHSFSQYYRHYKESAKQRKHTWNLPKEAFFKIVKLPCSYCGVPPTPKSFAKHFPNAKLYTEHYLMHAVIEVNGVDRVDNTLGYSEENCVPCCTTCNYAKRDKSKEEYERWLDRVAVFRQNQTA